MNENPNTYVSFYLRKNRIRIFRSTIRFLNTPSFIQFRFNNDNSSMVMEPHEVRSFTTLRVPQNIYSDNGSMAIGSKALCRILADKLYWDINSSYRVPGRLIPSQGLVVFDLSKAELIPSYNAPTIPYILENNDRRPYDFW